MEIEKEGLPPGEGVPSPKAKGTAVANMQRGQEEARAMIEEKRGEHFGMLDVGMGEGAAEMRRSLAKLFRGEVIADTTRPS